MPQHQNQRVNFPVVFFFFFNESTHWVRQGGERVLHLPQYVSSLIKDEQLCAMGDAVFFFFIQCPDFPSTCGIAD